MTALQDAVNRGDSSAYMQAVRANPQFAAAFPGGIPPEMEQGLLADFQRDQLRTSGEPFSVDKLMSGLQGLWQKLTSGDLNGAFQSLMDMFNGQADPARLQQLDQSANAGLNVGRAEQQAVYRNFLDQTKPDGTPATPAPPTFGGPR